MDMDIKDIDKGIKDIVSAFNDTRERVSMIMKIGADIKTMIGDYLPDNDVIDMELNLDGSVTDEAFAATLKRIVRWRSHVDVMITLNKEIRYYINAIGACDAQLRKLHNRIESDKGNEQEAARKLWGIRNNQRTILAHRLERLMIAFLDFRKDCVEKVAELSKNTFIECNGIIDLAAIFKKRTCEEALVKMEEDEYEITDNKDK